MAILTEKTRIIAVTAVSQDDNYLYEVSYQTSSDGKKLQNLSVNIKGLKDNTFKGSMNINADGLINTNFNNADIDTVAMMTLFNSIIAEVKAGLII